jgi:hypothetical protein
MSPPHRPCGLQIVGGPRRCNLKDMGRLQCVATVHTRWGRRSRVVPPIGCTRSFLIGPATLFGPEPRHTGFSPEKTFPEKKICMGKQKNRLTTTFRFPRPARSPAACTRPPLAGAVAHGGPRPCCRRPFPVRGYFFPVRGYFFLPSKGASPTF